MKIIESLKTKKAEGIFSTSLVVVLLLILPMWGAVAMLVGSTVGLAVYVLLFQRQLWSRGWIKAVLLPVAVGAVIGAALELSLWSR